jgi:hypothetical protein
VKVLHTRYRVQDFFNDSSWHSVNMPSDLTISITSPFAILVGITTEVNTILGDFTKLQTNFLWRHTFNSANSTNFYSSSPANGSNGSITIQNLNVGITTTDYYTINSVGPIVEGYITTGTDGKTRTTLSQLRFASYNDWYFNEITSYPSSASARAIACRFLANYVTDLPTTLYSLSGRTITWNTTSPLYTILYGQSCTVA